MHQGHVAAPAYVIKAEELPALNYIERGYPRPQGLEWIDRGRDAKLRSTTIEMLVRTLFRGTGSPSVQRLHRRAGLRVIFRTTHDRRAFAAMFKDAMRHFELENSSA